MKQRQTTLKTFLDLESGSEQEEVSQYSPSPQKGAGAPKIPDMWTRVKSLEQMRHRRITVFDIDKDLDSDKALKAVRR